MKTGTTFKTITALALAAGLALATASAAQDDENGSLRFIKNATGQQEYANISHLPARFGRGEFTLELWIKPDASYPVGPTPLPQDPFPADPKDIDPWAGNEDQLTNWSDADAEPYSWTGWWWPGNWLLDGFARNYGGRDGSFALQMYGGGRLRWLFDDGTGPSADKGYVYSVGVYPATGTPSLLDDKWHNVQAGRRWVGEDEAQLELWIDGKMIASEIIPSRVDMQEAFWRDWGVGNPPGLQGWFIGGEEQASAGVHVDYLWNQYEDYKGLVDELRFWDRAKPEGELAGNWRDTVNVGDEGLVGYYTFANVNTPGRHLTTEETGSGQIMSLQKFVAENFSAENAPVKK